MRKLFIVSILTMTFCAEMFAQTKTLPCPVISVTGPAGVTNAGETITFTANISEINTTPIAYSWTISDGTIIEGFGTSVIKVATNSDTAGKIVTATVEINGLPIDCNKTALGTAQIPYLCVLPRTLDIYEKMSFQEEKARLANLAFELNENTDFENIDFIALFIIYLVKEDTYSSVKKRIDNISKYLIENQQIPKERFRFHFSENGVQRTVIYILPPDVVDNFSNGVKNLAELRSLNQISPKKTQKNQKRK